MFLSVAGPTQAKFYFNFENKVVLLLADGYSPSGISTLQRWRKLKLRKVWRLAQDHQLGLTGAEPKFIWL